MSVRARFTVVAVAAALVLVGAACAPGTPDLGYSPTGVITYGPFGGAGGALDLVARADGGVIASRSGARPLTRIGPGGVVDPSWGSSLPNDCRTTSRTIATGTGVLFTCSHLISPTEGEAWQIWRVTAAGKLDTTFGGADGIVDAPADLDHFDVVPLPNGGYLGLGQAVAAPSRTSVPPLIAIVYSANGTVTSTTPITITVTPLPAPIDGYGFGFSLTRTPNGVAAVEQLVASIPGNSFLIGQSRIQHFDANGAILDSPIFSGTMDVGFEAIAGLAGLGDGRTAVISRSTTVNIEQHTSRTDSFLRMIGADGSADSGFGSDGTVSLRLPSGEQLDPRVILATNDDRYLVVAGSIPGGRVIVARYDADTGALDPTFGNRGTFPLLLASVQSAVVRGNADQLYFGGFNSGSEPTVARNWNHTVN